MLRLLILVTFLLGPVAVQAQDQAAIVGDFTAVASEDGALSLRLDPSRELQRFPDAAIVSLDTHYPMRLRGRDVALVVAAKRDGNLALYIFDPENRRLNPEIVIVPEGEFDAASICLWAPAGEQQVSLFAGSSDGTIRHMILLPDEQDSGGGEPIAHELIRTVVMRGPVTDCAADDPNGSIYAVIAGTGVYRFAAEAAPAPMGSAIESMLAHMRNVAAAVGEGEQVIEIDDAAASDFSRIDIAQTENHSVMRLRFTDSAISPPYYLLPEMQRTQPGAIPPLRW